RSFLVSERLDGVDPRIELFVADFAIRESRHGAETLTDLGVHGKPRERASEAADFSSVDRDAMQPDALALADVSLGMLVAPGKAAQEKALRRVDILRAGA